MYYSNVPFLLCTNTSGKTGFEICWDLTTVITNTDLVRDFPPAADYLIDEGFSGDNKSVIQTSLT